MDKTLIELIADIQNGDQDSLESIINKFKPIICKLARKLNYEEAETDLIIVFIQLVRFIKLENFMNISEGALVNYLYNSLKNKAVDLFRKYVLKKKEEVSISLDLSSCDEDVDSKLFINDLLDLDI